MRKTLRSKLTYSNVVSSICLFLLLGGVAYAAGLAPNSVGTKQLKNGAVTLKKINKQAQSKLRGAVGPKGDPGKEGKKGDKGAKGSAGDPGAPGTPGAPGVGVAALFGSGADGNATVSGPSGNTLVRDMYFNNLTLETDAVLNTNGYRLFVAGTLTMAPGSNINRDGLSAIMGCGPWTSPLPAHTLGGAGAGGCHTINSGEGGSVTNSLGGEGGGTSPGTAEPPEADVGGAQVFDSATQALTGRSLDGELVYGGGGGEGSNPSADGGGQGGGVVVIAARTVASSGSTSITANGGEGLYGGGGGVVVVISTSAQPAGLTISAVGGDGQGSGAELAEAGFAEWLD